MSHLYRKSAVLWIHSNAQIAITCSASESAGEVGALPVAAKLRCSHAVGSRLAGIAPVDISCSSTAAATSMPSPTCPTWHLGGSGAPHYVPYP